LVPSGAEVKKKRLRFSRSVSEGEGEVISVLRPHNLRETHEYAEIALKQIEFVTNTGCAAANSNDNNG
jgi:hypothetical protein